jgi:KAP family P-loop domain
MWSDNETAVDLLGFKVHADLIREVVTDVTLLPVVAGVFGDWGGGKSSIMKMLQQDLTGLDSEHTACLYFNGWLFEGYEDAKTALLTSVLIQLGEHKRFGPKIRASVVGLLKRVKWMEATKLGVKHIGLPLLAAMSGGDAGLAATVAAMTPLASPEGDINWSKLIKESNDQTDLLELRKFRDDFGDMLAKTDIAHLVVIIDDLDRCLPDRIIETLEAIKLFFAVPKTAFVIGADPRIVRHAIATRYVARQLRPEDASRKEEYDLVQDYLEKLIQIPYFLPRLSPAEIESYINLLACQKFLDAEETKKVLAHWNGRRKSNFYASYQQSAVKEALSPNRLPENLEKQLAWSAAVSGVLTEGLKGNPRQVKRMLNAMLLRKKLASVAGIAIKDDVLAKLMVLEYAHPLRFDELNNWQTAEGGYPSKLKALEGEIRNKGESEQKIPEGFKDWDTRPIRGWIEMQPPLAEVDLCDYFWLARDRTSSTLSGVTLVAPIVRRIFDQLVSGNDGERRIAAKQAIPLDSTEKEMLLQIMSEELKRHPERTSPAAAFEELAAAGVEGTGPAFIAAVANASPATMLPGIAFKIDALAKGSLLAIFRLPCSTLWPALRVPSTSMPLGKL